VVEVFLCFQFLAFIQTFNENCRIHSAGKLGDFSYTFFISINFHLQSFAKKYFVLPRRNFFVCFSTLVSDVNLVEKKKKKRRDFFGCFVFRIKLFVKTNRLSEKLDCRKGQKEENAAK
jgi:hypothetical protein